MKTILLDASALGESSCILRVHRKIIDGYSSETLSADIVFGSACHAYFKVRDETADDIKGLAAALDYWKKTPKFFTKNTKFMDDKLLTDVCMSYPLHYNADPLTVVKFKSGNSFVEQRIAYPYYITPEKDIEIVLCGTLDKLVYNSIAGFYAIGDYKTTKMWDISKYLDSYRLSGQLRTYKLLLKLFAKLFPDSILSEIINKPLACFIDGIFLSPSVPIQFKRSEMIWFSDEDMIEYQRGLDLFIQHKLIPSIREPEKYLFREGIMNKSCDKVYGPCEFSESCSKDNDTSQRLVLSDSHIQRQYNPMTHGA